MYQAKDGKNFGNSEMGRHYDATRPGAAKERVSTKAGEGHEGHDGGEKDVEGVVAEHGPATHVEITSHHEDGHKHKAVHHDHESAREHVTQAFGEHEADGAKEHDGGDEDEIHAGEGMPSIPGFGG